MIFVIEHEGRPVGAIKLDGNAPVIMISRDLAYEQATEEQQASLHRIDG